MKSQQKKLIENIKQADTSTSANAVMPDGTIVSLYKSDIMAIRLPVTNNNGKVGYTTLAISSDGCIVVTKTSLRRRIADLFRPKYAV